MDYEVSLQTVAACPTAVVAQATTWQEFPRIWVRLLDQVYAFLRDGGAAQDGQNIMLYRDDVPNVEVGVQVARLRWEIYGDWREDPAELETQVSYLLR